jgi:cytochrome P450
VLDALPFYPGRITIVCYEDLSDSPSMLAALGERLGIEALLNFRGDNAGGRRNMAPEVQTLIDAVTRETRARLDAARSILPGAGAAPPPCAAAPDASETAFVHDPLGQLREARERAGVYHHQQSDTWVVLRYDDVAASLADLGRFACNIDHLAQNRFIGSQDLVFHARLRRLLEPHLTTEWTHLYTSRIEQRTRGILNELAVAGQFDLVSAFALRLYMDLRTEWSGSREADSLMARITADPQFTPQELSDLGSSIPVFLKTLINFIANAVHHLLFHPKQEATLRARPADIPAFVDEVMRLFPPAFGVTRMTRQSVKMAGLEIPAEAQVVLAVFSANRDSGRYEQPDEMLLHRNGPPHLSFSDGPEAWFVRRIGQVERETVLRVLLSEFPPLRPMCPAAEVRFAASPEFYVPSALPVRFAS